MPRAAANPPHIIYEALKDLRFINDEGGLLPWGNDVWQKAADAMDGKMSKDYLYIYLSQNRNGVFYQIHGCNPKDLVKNATNDKSNDGTNDSIEHESNWSMGETDCALPAIRETITISKSEWAVLKSCIQEYKTREYEVLVIGWADALYDILWTHMKLPCPFSFKNAKINRNPGETFLTVKGSCSECGSKINIYCPTEPANDDTRFHVSTFDSRGIAHQKKRRVAGERRLRIGKELQGKTTYVWRRDEANRLMEFGDIIPANIPSEEVIRKAKQEARDKELGLFKIKSALASLWDMKYGLEFNGCIHEIGLDKFFLMYWTPTQLYMYNKFIREDQIGTISIDATGSLVKQIPKPDGSKRVVYLYQAVCGYRQKILPLFQLISEKHDTNTLTYWIREWLRSGGSCPKQVVTDYSLALLNAASLAFNNTDLKTYISNCIVFNTNRSSVRIIPPRCTIRLDISHFVNMVARWNCFNNENPEKKDFYLRCVGLLTTCREINDFIQVCTDVLTIAFATHENIDDKQSHCFAAQNRVLQRLKSYRFPNNDTGKLDNYEDQKERLLQQFSDIEEEIEQDSSSAIEAIYKKIVLNSKCDLEQGRLNPYYCNAFGSQLLKLIKQFVLWTAVMTVDDPNSTTHVNLSNDNDPRFVSSSARSEEYFRELKQLVFKKEKSIRVDKFLVIHLRNLAGTNILLNADIRINKKTKTDTVNLIHSTPRLDSVEEKPTCLVSKCLTSPSEMDLSNSFRDENSIPVPDLAHGTGQLEQDFLNEYEDWRGLTKKADPQKMQGPPKKRGKYLTPCPDLQLIHQRPKFSLALPLLVNGNSLGPAKIGNSTIAVRNTCAFDSVAQSMLAAYHDIAPYNEHVSQLKVPLYEFVKTLSKSGVNTKLYNERAEILKFTTQINNGVMDCETNIATLIESQILTSIPSLKIEVNCRDCKLIKIHSIPVLDLNPDPIFREAMMGLQEAVSLTAGYYESRIDSKCCFCKGDNTLKTFDGGSHIFLNIEAAEVGLIAARLGLENCRKKFTLSELPVKLRFYNSQYILVSAVIYVTNHYYACVRRASGIWEEYNDLCSSKRGMSITNRDVLKQRRIPLLFYVRI